MLAGVIDVQHFHDVTGDAVDEDIVGGDDGFPRVGHAPGTVHEGKVGQPLGIMFEQVGEADGGGGIAVRYIVDDLGGFLAPLGARRVRHQPRPVFLASMIARSSAIT